MNELPNPETDEPLVLYRLYVCMIHVWYARGSIRGSVFDIASQRLYGERKVQEYTGLGKMFAGRMFVTSVLKQKHANQ